MAHMTLRDVRKAFGALEIIKGVSLEIEDGEFVVLVGPSGCGKSTLLRMIAGLEEMSSGEMAIDGRRINDVPPKDRNIAMVFQNYALYPHMTVEQNMGFSLRLAGLPRAAVREKVTATAAALGLSDHLGRYPKELSGGQRQRVATGRAIVREPEVFLFDEPLSNLDAKLRVQMRSEIRELQQRLGVTAIYVTHDQVEAMTMADKIVVLRGGEIEQMGAPLDLYDRPANIFVATFIGSPAMNLLEGRVVDNRLELLDGFAVPLPAGLATGPVLTLGIRPDHIAVSEGPAPGAFPAEVASFEATGSETLLFLRQGGRAITVQTKARLPHLRPGATLWLAPDLAQAHLFGADGARAN